MFKEEIKVTKFEMGFKDFKTEEFSENILPNTQIF